LRAVTAGADAPEPADPVGLSAPGVECSALAGECDPQADASAAAAATVANSTTNRHPPDRLNVGTRIGREF
jgi:hypothetical protein